MHRTLLHPMLFALALLVVAGPLHDADARPVYSGARTSVNVNRNVDRNVSRNVDVHRDIDVDVDRGYYRGGYPVARAAATTAAVAATAAAVGSIVYSLPPNCATMMSGGVAYQRCGNAYYQPRYSGTQVTYVVVNAP